MIELIVNEKNQEKIIALVENGKLVELYRDNNLTNRLEGNIYIGKVEDIINGMQAAFVNIGTERRSFIHLKDILPKINQVNIENSTQIEDISKVVKLNDKILVQVKKDSTTKKGAKVSTHISLTSTYIILMPNTNIITISKKIVNEDKREKLLQLVKSNLPKNMGAIIRTSSLNKPEIEIINDIKYLVAQWKKILNQYNEDKPKSPQLLYQAPNIVEKIIIDLVEKNLENIIVNNQKEYEYINKLLQKNNNFQTIKLQLKETENLFDVFDLESQIEKANYRKIWLNCGGFITIDKTEALTAIDVNTGKFVGKSNLEETVYKVNSEATIEIAKQLRLRDIGGIIIIDYIDMTNKKHKDNIEKLLKDYLKTDRAKTQVEGFTKLDLMELTRKHICSNDND